MLMHSEGWCLVGGCQIGRHTKQKCSECPHISSWRRKPGRWHHALLCHEKPNTIGQVNQEQSLRVTNRWQPPPTFCHRSGLQSSVQCQRKIWLPLEEASKCPIPDPRGAILLVLKTSVFRGSSLVSGGKLKKERFSPEVWSPSSEIKAKKEGDGPETKASGGDCRMCQLRDPENNVYKSCGNKPLQGLLESPAEPLSTLWEDYCPPSHDWD